jgi:hypothetical protein
MSRSNAVREGRTEHAPLRKLGTRIRSTSRAGSFQQELWIFMSPLILLMIVEL